MLNLDVEPPLECSANDAPELRLKKSEWMVRPVSIEAARPMIEKYHYAAGASNTATYLHGLFRIDDIFDNQAVAFAWWIPPTKTAANATYPKRWQGVLCLSRLVVMPGIPKNACTFLLSRSRKQIDRAAWPCLVTYADDWRGHTGAIYKADNWTYIGKTKPERTYQIDGRMTARKAGGAHAHACRNAGTRRRLHRLFCKAQVRSHCRGRPPCCKLISTL